MLLRYLKGYYLDLIKPYQSWENINNRFILSSGRTGTKFFKEFLNQNFSDVYSLHEPYPKLRSLAINQFRKSLSQYKIIKDIYYMRRPILNQVYKSHANYYIESNPSLKFLISYMKQVFPNTKIMAIIRDLRTYILSAYNKSPDRSHEKFYFDQYDEQNRLTPKDIGDDKYASMWPYFSRVEKIAWQWRMVNNHIIKCASDDNNFLIVRYEDLFDEEKGPKEIKKIVFFFGLTPPAHFDAKYISTFLKYKSNTTQISYLKSFKDLPDIQQESVLDIGRDCIQNYYEL